MTLVFEDADLAGPATHALVIGVGDYPFLPGGSGGHRTPHDDGMRQLSSPPVSARRVVDWLIESFDNPDRPLATVELLLADAADDGYRPPVAPRSRFRSRRRKIEVATIAQIADASARLKDRGNSHADNQLIIYFCGHGISAGPEFALVASDYGAMPNRPYFGLISFPDFLVGMSDCAAMRQCYFIDACRSTSEMLVAARNYAGDPLVAALAAQTRGLRQSVYFSTLGGAAAHGREGEPSLFTAALLLALAGAAASDANDSWWVNTTRLFEALGHLMEHVVDPAIPVVQVPQSGTQIQFDLHRLPGEPELPLHIPVDDHVGGDPPSDVALCVIAEAGEIAQHPPAQPPLPRGLDWRWRHFEAWLEPGMYEVELRRPSGVIGPVRRRCPLQPPGRRLGGF